ncbi:hypothetical protein [Dactylosporangium sp. NPDC049140]|uniref:HAAS signaling domain-containing protein n=1 Tax=Dactylosporangium sp. NPDC049140 TaxID=3155647 RepID=UPI0033D9EB23
MNAPSGSSLEIDYYLERVAAALADLPPEVRDDLMEDLPAHFAEVLEEQGGSLVDRLGPPAAYAAELRAAAGVESGSRTVRAGIDLDQLRSRLRTLDERSGRIIGYERTSDFLRLLRPAWWVARGVAVVVLVFALDILPADRLVEPIGLVLMAAAAVVSVRIGTTGRPHMHRLVAVGVNAVAIIGLLVVAANLDRLGMNHTYTPESYNPYGGVVDVYPVDEEGRPLQHVTLYDQDGNPISLGDAWRCHDGQGPEPGSTPTYPLCPIGRAAPSPSSSPSPSTAPSGSASASPSASPSPSR